MENNQSTNVIEKTEASQPQENTVIQNGEVETQEQTQEINWKKFREQREIERKLKIEAEKKAAEKEAEASALKAAMDALLNKQSTNSSHSSNDQYSDDEESDDVRIQKKIDAALSARERQYEQQRIQKEQAEFPQKLVSTYNDFNDVCTTENLDYLEYHYPEVASAFTHAPDGFDKWASIYKAVKRFVPNTSSQKEQKKAEKNFNKPQAMAASGATQTGDSAPMQLDDKRRQDNWSRMQRVMKGGR